MLEEHSGKSNRRRLIAAIGGLMTVALSGSERQDAANCTPRSLDGNATDGPKQDLIGTVNRTIDTRADLARTKARPVNLRESSPDIDWTGESDSSAALQKAITSAGPGTRLELGRGGRIRSDIGITMQPFQTLAGPITQVATGPTAPVEIAFPALRGNATAITMGTSCELERVLLRGSGYENRDVVGIRSNFATARLSGVQIVSFGTGILLSKVWYGVLNEVEFRHNATALSIDNCYNLTLNSPQINGSNGDAFGNGIVDNGETMFNIFGGSIEQTQIGIRLSSKSSANLNGTYWESSAPMSVGIDATGVQNSIINVLHSQVYLYYDRWIDFTGASQSLLNSGGNFFKVSERTGGEVTAYKFDDELVDSEVSIGFSQPDSWNLISLLAPQAIYANNSETTGRGLTVVDPIGGNERPLVRFGRSLALDAGSVIAAGAGATAQRPDANVVPPGAMWYDTSLSKPIWSTGEAWKDALGADA